MLPAKTFTSPNVARENIYVSKRSSQTQKCLQIMHKKIKFTFTNMARENIYVSSNKTDQYINISSCGSPKPARHQTHLDYVS